MDSTGIRLLRRARICFTYLFTLFTSFTSFTLVTLGAFLASAAPCLAAELYAPQAVERATSYGFQIFELLADVVATDLWETSIKNIDEQAAQMANWKHAAYDDNHRTVDRAAYFRDASYGADLTLGAGDTLGYMEITSDDISGGRLPAERYRQRVTNWRDAMKMTLAGNNNALNEILESEQMISAALQGARHENAGYTQRADEAAYLEAVLDDELLKLNADIDRRLALETRIALNEQLERSDAVAAYGLAVGDWRPIQSAAGDEY